MKNTFIKGTLSIIAGMLVFLSCSNLTGNDFKDPEASASEFSQMATPDQIRGFADLLPEGMSIEDVAPTRYKTSVQRTMQLASANLNSEPQYTFMLLPSPQGNVSSYVTAFNNNGSVLFATTDFTSYFRWYFVNSSMDTTTILNDRGLGGLGTDIFASAGLNDKGEAVFYKRSDSRVSGRFTNSYTWSKSGGLNIIELPDRPIPYSYINDITNNSTIFGLGSLVNENGDRLSPTIFRSDLSGTAINYSGAVGHDIDLNLLRNNTRSLVANDLDEVAFTAINRDVIVVQSDKQIGFISSTGNLQYYTANGFSYMDRIFEMNDNAQIVGSAFKNGVAEPAIWKDGNITILPYPDVYGIVIATSINNSGYIAGYGNNVNTGRIDILLWTPDLQVQKIETENTELSAYHPFINEQNEIAVTAVVEEDGLQKVLAAILTKQNSDNTPPEIISTQEIMSLWPANHKMKLAISGITATDDQDPDPVVEVKVSSSEALNGTGDGNTESDWEITQNSDGSYDVYLRAERDGAGQGRIYTIEVTATDASGNTATETLSVSVPHDRSGLSVN